MQLRRAPRGAKAAWAYPLVGLAVGVLGAGMLWIAAATPPGVAAGLALVAMIVVTGALHEDGLADSTDGLWGGWTRERRLEIMRDSRIGAYGVLSLILALGLRWLCLAALASSEGGLFGVIAVATLSRAAMVGVMAALPQARPSGLAASTGRASGGAALLAFALAFACAVLLLGSLALWLALAAYTVACAAALCAKAKIGGQTGDILGATQQVAEIAALITLATLLG